MKTMLGFSIAVVTVGMCFLIFCGQTRNNAVAAQGRKPVMIYRFYTGKDVLSHMEKIEVKTFDQNNIADSRLDGNSYLSVCPAALVSMAAVP